MEELEWGQKKKKKKRGRREENVYYNDIKQPTKKQDYSKVVREKSEDSSSCSKDDTCYYISSENHVALGVFDFPWMHEGIISKSEDWDYLQDAFSSSLEDTCFRSRIQISESTFYESSCATADEDKRVNFNQSDEQEMDCIWASLLNQPLQQGGYS